MPEDELTSNEEEENQSGLESVKQISGMYQEWFLDYASYVILERAVPALEDGLKPVQRRILHSMKELDDGRYHKVANLIGNTMKYHPHGDASIGDALVQLGQKELLIDTQGNWGNILTGDSAAAPRYIEARLTKFALEVVFNHKTTKWLPSYDGRGKEPVHLPVKFPLLLAQGADGIAVGLSTKILPHNFNELLDASINILRGKSFSILPDFLTAGMADFSQYNDGKRGGRIRVRGKINIDDKRILRISELPYGTTTTSLIESIIKANDKGKIKIKKIEDNTAEQVEILIHLPSGVSPDKMVDALYAFTDCEISLSPNACVIENNKPRFMGVSEMLEISTRRTVELLRQELEIRLLELEELWHFASLERLFIEKRIYRKIEDCETWESVLSTIHKGLKPYSKQLRRKITDEDVIKLTDIRIKKISRFDLNKAAENIHKLQEEIDRVKHNLANLNDYAIDYFKNIKKKYGEGKKRMTEIKSFNTIQRAKVASANVKLMVNKEEGFIGYGLKRNESEFVADCSDIDDVIVIRDNGKMSVTRITEKTFVGKGIIYAGVWKRGDDRTIYNMIYQDGKGGRAMVKRFSVTSITRDKDYDLTKGKPHSKILYLTVNPNGEAEVVHVLLRAKHRLKKVRFEFDFSSISIKGRGSVGNILTKHMVRRIEMKAKGVSTLSARKIWFDDTVQRLNTEGRGVFLGSFARNDKILTITQKGTYQLMGFDLFTQFDDDLILLEKWVPQKPISAIYYNGSKKQYYAKRFLIEKTSKATSFIGIHKKSFLEVVTSDRRPVIELKFSKENGILRDPVKISLEEFIDIKGDRAIGNRLSQYPINRVDLLDPLPYNENDDPNEQDIKDTGMQTDDTSDSESDDKGLAEKKSNAEEQKNSSPKLGKRELKEPVEEHNKMNSTIAMKKKSEQRQKLLNKKADLKLNQIEGQTYLDI